MYLSKLKLNGFKSFADETRLDFDEGVTAIVGPNGCGKSNIVDAVRWVIGEQRPTALRSQKMENVIFNGTEARKALGMAEVELTIQNNRGVLPTEYSEVSLGRRLFRSGDSEYLMNGTQCRLKDITELFMDTGMGADAYSVIELKMIDEILSDNAQDRRRLFEEAAGITKYKQRRRQALRKLENTQADLTRLRDLTDEIGKSVRRLKRQAGKAETYNELSDTLHKLELNLARSTFESLSARQKKIRVLQADLDEALEEQERNEKANERELTKQQEEQARCQQIVRDREQALQHYRDQARDLKAEVRLYEERIETAEGALSRLQLEKESANTQEEDLQQLKAGLKRQIEATAPALEASEKQLEEADSLRTKREQDVAEHRTHLKQVRHNLDEAQRTRADHQRKLDRIGNRIELKEEDIERTETRASALEGEGQSLTDRIEQARIQQTKTEERVDEAQHKLDEALDRQAELEKQLEDANAELRSAERREDSARAEVQLLENLLNSFEEFSDAVQFLADDSTWSDRRIRTVADVLACKEQHRVALETALGDLASCVVASDGEEAKRALGHLRTSGAGQATFIMLDALSTPSAQAEVPGNSRPLRDLVRVTSEDCAPLADVLLHNRFLSDSLSEAQDDISGAAGSAICITPDGEWINADGVVHGGSKREQPTAVGGRIGRREQLDEAKRELAEASSALTDREHEVNALKESLDNVDVAERRSELQTVTAQRQEARQELERAEYARETHEQRRGEFTDRLDELRGELADLRASRKGLDQNTQGLIQREKQLEEELSSRRDLVEEAEAAYRQALDRYNDARVETVEARNESETLQRDLERAEDRLQSLTRRAERREEEIEEQHQTIETSTLNLNQRKDALADLQEKQPQRERRVEEARQQAHAVTEEINALQEALRKLRKEREELLSKKNELAVQRAEIDTRLADLRERIRENYEKELESLPEARDDFDAEAAKDEIKSIKAKIARMGSVNPLAVDEYEEEKERLDFLSGQQEDLEQAEETLLETITEINRTAANRFDDTFSAIQENFGTLFVRLFGEGASARLTLDESDDPLDADINILAQPAGKKPSVLTQLSGGEKALTAIALLFSIYLVKPSPFCILDEVDAPLDDTNVQRFMNLIRDFEDDTQFILVTHDKHTMSMSDRMYGITMQEKGISTLVSVEFDEALAMAET